MRTTGIDSEGYLFLRQVRPSDGLLIGAVRLTRLITIAGRNEGFTAPHLLPLGGWPQYIRVRAREEQNAHTHRVDLVNGECIFLQKVQVAIGHHGDFCIADDQMHRVDLVELRSRAIGGNVIPIQLAHREERFFSGVRVDDEEPRLSGIVAFGELVIPYSRRDFHAPFFLRDAIDG